MNPYTQRQREWTREEWGHTLEVYQPIDDAYDWFANHAREIEHARRLFGHAMRAEAIRLLMAIPT